jgi:hypothetical protein
MEYCKISANMDSILTRPERSAAMWHWRKIKSSVSLESSMARYVCYLKTSTLSDGSQTLKIAYDVVVDGTLRASNFYLAKAVTCLKGRKFGFDNFLYQKGKGILETAMKVSVVAPGLATKSEGQETLGTVEVRLYVLRRFGEEHDIEGLRIYDDTEEKADNNDSDQKKQVTYHTIEPDLTMAFEEDCVSLGTKGMKAQRSKVSKPRPGKAPWAVFRFHYRTKGQYHQVPHGRDSGLTKYRCDRGP